MQFTWLLTFWHLLRERWLTLFGHYRQWQRGRLLSRTPVDAADGAPAQVHWSKRGLDWRRLDPTQQVRYFYLTTLERAKEQGIGRTVGETPSQYAPRLAAHVAGAVKPAEEGQEANSDPKAVQKLTDAFIQARYSKQPLQKPESTLIAQIWENLKVYLSL